MNKKSFIDILKKIIDKQNLIVYLEALLISGLSFFIVFHFIYILVIIEKLSNLQQFYLTLGFKISLILIIIYYFLQAQKNCIKESEAAGIIDKLIDNKSDTVQNALDFSQKATQGNEQIKERYYDKANEILSEIKYPYDFSSLKRWLIPLLCVIIGNISLIYFQPDNMLKTWNLFRSRKITMEAFQKHIEVKPGSLNISRNLNLFIEVVNPEQGVNYTFWISQGEKWKKESLINPHKQLYNLEQSFKYYIQSAYGASDTFYVKIIDEPVVKKLNIKINYPSYTGLKAEYKENSDGNISVLQGSSLAIDIETDETIESGNIVFSDKNFKPLKKIGKTNWGCSFTALQSFSYHFSLMNKLKVQSKPVVRNIMMIPDRAPEIQVVYPARDTLLPQSMKYSISFQANDDFGLRNLKIHYLFNNNMQRETLLKKDINGSLLEMNYTMDFEDVFLLPGDQVTYWLEVEDNSPKVLKAFSKRYVLRFQSMEEIFEKNEEQETENKENLSKALQETKKLQEEFEKKRREMLRKNEANQDDKKDIQQMLKKQENISDLVDNVSNEYQKMINNLEKNQVVSEEIMNKMQKIQELMEEINNPELQKTMEEMQKNLSTMNPEAMKKAMENMKFSMEDFSEKLQQTLDLLESVKKEVAVQKLSEMAKEMEKVQSALNEKTQDSKNVKDLADEQKALNDKMKNLQKEMQESSKLFNSQKDKEAKEQLNEMMKEMQEENLDSEMQEAMEQMQQGNKQEAQKKQKSSLQKMAKLSKKLDKMKSSMGGSDMKELMEAIQSTIRRLLLFSKMHEELNNKFTHDPYPIVNDMIANFEGIQSSLQKLYSSPQVLLVLGQKFFYDSGDTQKAYRDFFTEINENQLYEIKNTMSKIQKGINLMAFDLIQALNNMQGGGGGGGGMQSLMQQLQQMGQEQMAMNMMTQSMMKQMMGNGNQASQQARQQMQRLGSDEQKLAENLKRTLQTNNDAQKQTQQINQMIEELEAISRQLKQGRIDQNILDRQNRIMSKLLDIEKSVQKREFSQKRKGETNEQNNWNAPESVKNRFKDQQRKVQLQEDIKKYPKEYQDVIKEYLKRVNE